MARLAREYGLPACARDGLVQVGAHYFVRELLVAQRGPDLGGEVGHVEGVEAVRAGAGGGQGGSSISAVRMS
jgi:hypothetical protein